MRTLWQNGRGPTETVNVAARSNYERELVTAAAGGDATAVAELYRRHAAAAHRLAETVTRNPHDAADAVSESFTRVLQTLRGGQLSVDVHFRSYLLTACRHAAIDLVRAAARAQPTSELEVLDRPAGGPQPADRILAAVDATHVASAFQSLSGRWREVLWLTEVDGLAPRDAAARLGLSPNGASQLAFRARAALRNRFLEVQLEDLGAGRSPRRPKLPKLLRSMVHTTH